MPKHKSSKVNLSNSSTHPDSALTQRCVSSVCREPAHAAVGSSVRSPEIRVCHDFYFLFSLIKVKCRGRMVKQALVCRESVDSLLFTLQNEGICLPPNLCVRSRIVAIRLYPCSELPQYDERTRLCGGRDLLYSRSSWVFVLSPRICCVVNNM